MILIEPGSKAPRITRMFFDHRKQHVCVSAGQSFGAPGRNRTSARGLGIRCSPDCPPARTRRKGSLSRRFRLLRTPLLPDVSRPFAGPPRGHSVDVVIQSGLAWLRARGDGEHSQHAADHPRLNHDPRTTQRGRDAQPSVDRFRRALPAPPRLWTRRLPKPPTSANGRWISSQRSTQRSERPPMGPGNRCGGRKTALLRGGLRMGPLSSAAG